MASCESNDRDIGRMEKKAKHANKMCIKCKEIKPGALIKNLVYCKECLQALVVQKFKKSIDEVLNIDTAPSSVLAIAFSGGLGSTLLLELVAATLCASGNRRSRRHRWEHIHVIYIDDSKALSSVGRDPRPIIDFEAVLAKYPDYHLTQIPIENAFCSSINNNGSPEEALHSYLSSLPTRTAVFDSIQLLKQRLIQETARTLGVTHVLLGRTMSSLSTALLSSICSGRGFTIAQDRQTEDNGVTSFNPLKDLGSKECALWAWWADLPISTGSILRMSNNGSTSSVAELTRAFIAGLDHDYPSTVSTIVKTCAKVVPRDSPAGTCRLCARRMQNGDQLAAVRDLVALTSVSGRKTTEDLCYACQTMLTSGNSRSIVVSSFENVALPFSSREDQLHI